jgi:hypothetical protein
MSIARYADESRRLHSPNVWKDFPLEDAGRSNQRGSTYWFEDFKSFSGLLASTRGIYASDSGGFESFQDAGTIAQLAASLDGVVRIDLAAATDNLEAYLAAGAGLAGLVAVDLAATPPSGTKKTIFEARIATQQIAGGDLFVGLGETGLLVTTGLFALADTIGATADVIGFRVLAAAPTELDMIFAKAGAETVVKDVAQILVAGTFYKVAFVIDHVKNKVEAFIDNVSVGSKTIGTTPTQDVALASFLDNVKIHFVSGVLASGTGTPQLDIDWAAIGQTPY